MHLGKAIHIYTCVILASNSLPMTTFPANNIIFNNMIIHFDPLHSIVILSCTYSHAYTQLMCLCVDYFAHIDNDLVSRAWHKLLVFVILSSHGSTEFIHTAVSAHTESWRVLWWYSNGPSWNSSHRLWMCSSHWTSGRNQPSMEYTSGIVIMVAKLICTASKCIIT